MTRIVLESPLAAVAGAALAAAALGLYAWAHRRRGRPWRQAAPLAALRGAVLAALVLLAARPVRVDVDEEARAHNRVVLLVDRSESMSLGQSDQTRYGQAVEMARRDLVPALTSAGFHVRAMLFAGDAAPADGRQIAEAVPDGRETNLGRAIARAAGEGENPPRAVVVLSDGVATETGDDPRAIAALAERGVPVIAVGIGRDADEATLSLEDVTAPPVASPRRKFRVTARLKATGDQPVPAFDLVLLREGKFVERRSIEGFAGARAWQESFTLTENQETIGRYAVQLLPPADPSIKSRKRTGSAVVRVRGEKDLGVLFVQGGLTWDYKFIRLALAADPTVRLTGLSRTSSGSTFLQLADDTSGASEGFPTTMEQLAAYRVVVLANLAANDLAPPQQELLAVYCSTFGGGVLMIGGADTFNPTWRGSRLEDLLPVRFAAGSPLARDEEVRWQLTEAALRHPVFQIHPAGEHAAAWSALPAFPNAALVEDVKPGAEVWAVRATSATAASSRAGPVLMAAQRYGAGRSAAICVKNFWRWRLAARSDPAHFDRFWQQLLRYLGQSGREAVTIALADQSFRVGADVRLVLERNADPRDAGAPGGKFRLTVADQAGRNVTDQNLELPAGQPVEATFRAEQPGSFTVTVLDERGAAAATRSIEVDDVSREFASTARSMETLRRWAAASDGLAVRAEDCDDPRRLVDEIKTRVAARSDRRLRQPVGVSGWVLAALVACLSAEWTLRKRWGLG